jgi:NRAMP (natural resistance-associated macrophage protein)-like metal ion transporter
MQELSLALHTVTADCKQPSKIGLVLVCLPCTFVSEMAVAQPTPAFPSCCSHCEFVLLLLLYFPCSFVYEMAVAQPNWLDVGKGFVPTGQLFTSPDMLYIAIGILGATVMPHNLYLHSAVIQTRAWTRCPKGRKGAIKYGTLDSSLSLLFAFLINASILILAGAAFYYGKDPHRCGSWAGCGSA